MASSQEEPQSGFNYDYGSQKGKDSEDISIDTPLSEESVSRWLRGVDDESRPREAKQQETSHPKTDSRRLNRSLSKIFPKVLNSTETAGLSQSDEREISIPHETESGSRIGIDKNAVIDSTNEKRQSPEPFSQEKGTREVMDQDLPAPSRHPNVPKQLGVLIAERDYSQSTPKVLEEKRVKLIMPEPSDKHTTSSSITMFVVGAAFVLGLVTTLIIIVLVAR